MALLPFTFARDQQVLVEGGQLMMGPEATALGLREARRRAGLALDLSTLGTEDFENRLAAMFDAGLVAEVEQLHARQDLNLDLPAIRAVGYRQGWEWLDDKCSFEEMREKAIVATRQLAKRQLTWLRRESAALWYDLQADGVGEEVIETLGGFLEA